MKNKEEKGISLIALIVTIIVLMILAVVSIQALKGNNGIINQANKAKREKITSEEKESIEWAAAQAIGDEENKTGILTIDNGKDLIDKYLKEYIKEKTDYPEKMEYTIYGPGEEVEGENIDLTNDVFVVKFKETENIYIIDANGNVHKDETNGNNADSKNEEIAERDGIALSETDIEVNNETTHTITISTNAKNLKITNSNNSVIEIIEKTDKKITFVSRSIGVSTILVETEKGKTARCHVLVHQEPKEIVLDVTNIMFDLSEDLKEYQITATIEPSTTNYNNDITWTSSNTNAVEVVSNGNENLKSIATIKAKANGIAVITAKTKNEKTASCTVTVHTSPTKITISGKTTLDISGMNGNKSEKLTINYEPSTSDIKKNITWVSDNSEIVTVNAGTITGVTNGSTTIRATTENGKTTQCSVIVQTSITTISLNKTSETLDLAGTKTVQLTATINPNSHTEGYSWISTNSNIASVSNGYVTGQSNGTVTIKAVSSSGKVSASCNITVQTSLSVNSGSTQTSYSLPGQTSKQVGTGEYEEHCTTRKYCDKYKEECYEDIATNLKCWITSQCEKWREETTCHEDEIMKTIWEDRTNKN